jgi:hypothetical protein
MTGERNLTDDDVDALADALEKRFEERFYNKLGQGLWGLIWKALIGVSLFIVGYQMHRTGAG